jgi:glycerol uptake facilitator-like aquaporin
LIFFILQVTNPNTTFIENELSGFIAIGIFIYIAREYAITYQGFINCIMVFSVNLIAGIRGDWSGFAWIWLWVLGDLIGAVMATFVYDHYF